MDSPEEMTAEALQSLSSSLAEIDRVSDETETLVEILNGKLQRQREGVRNARAFILEQSTTCTDLGNANQTEQSSRL